jgi:4'-phosphopantetheinyl transferase
MMPNIIYWTVSQIDPNTGPYFTDPVNSYLTPDELERLQQLRFPKRRAEWMQGRYTTKYLLQHSDPRFASLPANQVQVKNEPEGMPYLERLAPLERLPLQISISHREHLAFCALSHAGMGGLGADIELIEPRPSGFLEDFFTTNEFDLGMSYNEHQRDIWFTLVWSLKEAALKALGKGLRLDTRCVEITRLEESPRRLTTAETGWQKANLTYLTDSSTLWAAWWRKQGSMVYTLAAILQKDDSSPELHEVIFENQG